MLRRLWVWSALLLPLPLLFHFEFRQVLVADGYRRLGQILSGYGAQECFGALLLLAGAAHFLVLLAGVQVPFRLQWHDELARLRPFNRKIVWNYALFIFMLILAFGIETLVFRHELVTGDRPAIGMAVLIGGFWTLRLLVDGIYFSHDDWPEGPAFVIGHTLLNTLFVYLAAVYSGLVMWHCLGMTSA